MQTQETNKKQRVRILIWAICALTVATPILAAAILPASYTFIVPLGIALPFFTMSCLESAILEASPETSEVGVTKSRKVLVHSQRAHSDRPNRSSIASVNEGVSN